MKQNNSWTIKSKRIEWFTLVPLLCFMICTTGANAKGRGNNDASHSVSLSHTVQRGKKLSTGETVEAQFDDKYWFIKNSNGEKGFCDNQGTVVIPPSEHSTRPVGSDRFLREIYSDNGEITQELLGPGGIRIGELPSKIIVQGLTFHDGLLRVDGLHELGPYTGYIDLQGRWKIKPSKYLFGEDFQEGLAHADIVENGVSKQVLIDTNGQIVTTPFADTHIGQFYEGLAVATNKSLQMGVIDRAFRVIIPFEYERISIQRKNLLAYKDGCWHAFSKDGKFVLKFPKSITHVYANGTDDIWTVASGGDPSTAPGSNAMFGALDSKGKIIIPMKYKYIGEFFNGKAVLGFERDKNGQKLFGVINREGKIVYPCAYEYVDVSDEHMKVTKDSEIKFDKSQWIARCGRPAEWRRFLRDYKLIGMKQEKLLSLLGRPDIETDKNNGHFLYSVYNAMCGNAGGGRSVEIEINENQTVTGWRDVGSKGHSAWNRKNDRYKKWSSSVFDNIMLSISTVSD